MKSERSSLKRACCWSACARSSSGAHARVLDRQRRGDDDDLVGAAEPVGLEHHPAEARVDGQLGEPAAERR